MKKTTYFLSVLLGLTNCLGLSAQIFNVDKLQYGILPDGQSVSVVHHDDSLVERICIPQHVYFKDQRYSVVEIAHETFSDFSKLREVILPEGIKHIHYSAFENCKELQQINFPETLTEIGTTAFYNCSKLNFNIPTNLRLRKLGQQAFNHTMWLDSCKEDVIYFNNVLYKAINKDITSCYVKYGTTVIADQAFEDCHHMTYISLPDGLTRIGHSAFFNCTALTSCHIPESVVKVDDSVFKYCLSLEHVSLPHRLTSIPEDMFADCTSLSSIDLPSETKSIDEQAFKGCSNLKHLTLPNSIISIGYHAFSGCTSLKNVVIPQSLKSLGVRAWSNCDLDEVYIANENVENMSSFQINVPVYAGQIPSLSKHIRYTSNNTKVATVDMTCGEVNFTGVPGSAIITATVKNPKTNKQNIVSTEFHFGTKAAKDMIHTNSYM